MLPVSGYYKYIFTFIANQWISVNSLQRYLISTKLRLLLFTHSLMLLYLSFSFFYLPVISSHMRLSPSYPFHSFAEDTICLSSIPIYGYKLHCPQCSPHCCDGTEILLIRSIVLVKLRFKVRILFLYVHLLAMSVSEDIKRAYIGPTLQI